MNKLTALSKLANAWLYLVKFGSENDGLTALPDALVILNDKFGYIRRSMAIEDLAPQPKDAEGLNPAGPKYL